MKRCADSVRGRIGCARDRAVCVSQSHQEVAVIERVLDSDASLVRHHAFGAAQLVIKICHLLEVRSAAVVYDFDAAEVRARRKRSGANLLFAAEQGDASYSFTRAHGSGDDRARVIAFWQDY